MTESMPKLYDPTQVEAPAYQRWLESRAFHADPMANGASGKGNYAIVIPPPNVTGALHMGHALNNTIQDILIRWRRMQGYNALWMPGTDHAGIATQTVVEKRVLAEEGKRRNEFSRDAFIEKIQSWKDEYETRITHQLHAMGCSCDWDRQRFTMDETCAKAVREAFFRLFKDGLIYRGKRLVNWDPATETALADDEVEMQDIDGHFWYLRYPLAENVEIEGELIGHVTVATTRPETMLGDTAVAINPGDPRAGALTGKMVKLPIVDRLIPIVADDYVVLPDPEGDDPKAKFATGFLKVTPAHDPNDWEIGQRHDLPVINIMAPDGTISKDHGWSQIEENIHEAATFLAMDRFEAREGIVTWFRENNLLEEVKPYTHAVGHSYRSHVPIEPYLSDQWYVKVTDDRLAGAALSAMTPDQHFPSDGCVWKEGSSFQDSTSRDRKRAVTARVGIPAQANGDPLIHQHYLLTFTTYGAWLHGDKRGSVNDEHNLPGTPYIEGNEPWNRHEETLLKNKPFILNQSQRVGVRDAIIEICQHRSWRLIACNVRTNHVHIVFRADQKPERIMRDIKANATKKLRGGELITNDQKVWTRHGSTRYLNDPDALEAAWKYVIEGQGKNLGGMASDQGEPVTFLSKSLVFERKPLANGRGSLNASSDEPRATASGYDWEGGLTFHPPRYAKTFQTWHENIRDWCISRQLWWGHRIPVWKLSWGVSTTDGEQIWEDAEVISLLDGWINEAGIRNEVILRRPNETDKYVFICTRLLSTDIKLSEFRDILYKADRATDLAYGEKINVGPHLAQVVTSLEQDPDVLDTWFSSALWPISTMGWPGETDELKAWNPSSTLCTAREIITLWVSRMVMFNVYLRDCLPFKDVFIHAMIQDGEGQKMSKSLGNGVDPLDIIHSHGADALRFTMASMTTMTQDVRMPVDVVCPHSGETFAPKMATTKAGHRVAAAVQACPTDKQKKMVTSYGVVSGEVNPTDEMPQARNTSSKFDIGRNFCNKLWNASRFALMNLEDAAESHPRVDDPGAFDALTLEWEDRWMLSRLATTARKVTDQLEEYKFSEPAQELYKFFWNDLCDWYLEIIKPRMWDAEKKPTAQKVLGFVMDATLRLLHPITPFITESIFNQLNGLYPDQADSGSLIKAAWPQLPDNYIDENLDKEMELVQTTVRQIRDLRSRYNVPPKETVTASVKAPASISSVLDSLKNLIGGLTNVSEFAIGPDTAKPAGAAVAVEGQMEIYVHGIVDVEEEKGRLVKQKDEVSGFIANAEKKLANENFVGRAKPEIVQRERDKLAGLQEQLVTIEENLKDLS